MELDILTYGLTITIVTGWVGIGRMMSNPTNVVVIVIDFNYRLRNIEDDFNFDFCLIMNYDLHLMN